jgi:hypothetical protein
MRGALPSLRAPALAVALFGSTFGLYLAAAGRSYDYDSSETVGAFVATPSLLDPLRRQLAYNNHPLFSLLEHVVYTAGGTNETALRVLPCLFGALAVGVLGGWFGRRWGVLAGLSAGVLLAANPLFATEARSVRGYSLLTLCAIVSTLLLVRLVERPRRWTEFGYAVAVAAGVATHLYMVIVVLAQLAAIVAARRLRLVWPLAVGVVVGGCIYSGVAAKMIAYSRHQRGHFNSALPREAARALLGERTLAVAVFAALAIVGVALLRQRAVIAAVAALAVALIVDWAVLAPRDLYPRFLVWLVPGLAVLVAATVRRFPIAVVAAAVVVGLMIDLDEAHWTTPPLPGRQTAALVRHLAGEGRRVCVLPYTSGALMAYLRQPPHEVSTPEGFTACDAIVALAIGPHRLLLVARTDFPYHVELAAITPMVIRCRRPCRA